MSQIRCAVYTRKSNEEGLDQEFNSLDAQREAGLAYIKSQKHEGWNPVLIRYDDGGYSGGTMKRPALERLLDEIDKGRIDIVVVYKVDRLSRSLGDFYRMMQLFDQKQVSFVSVTQQFNTTTSMGRLTLNMLLSFAQFEREITGERIRDKITATKKKGHWVSGQPPLGYRRQREEESRGLYIVQDEAQTVREIYRQFIKSESLVEAARALNEAGCSTKRWLSSNGRWHGGKPLTQKYIYRILTNPVYIGKITHSRGCSNEIYDGLHDAIIDQATWDRSQQVITTQARASRHRWTQPHLLRGKLRTSEGFAMSPTSTHRPLTKRVETAQKRIVRYYVSQKAVRQGFQSCPIKTINAGHLDDLVRGVVLDHLNDESLSGQPREVCDRWIRDAIDAVVLAQDKLTVQLSPGGVSAIRRQEFVAPSDEQALRPTCHLRPEVDDDGNLVVRIQIKKLEGRRMLLAPDGRDLVVSANPKPKQHIVDAIGLAYRWHDDLIKTGLHIREYAASNGIGRTRILKLLPLTHLSPTVLRHALSGTLPQSTTLEDLLTAAKHLDWHRQAAELGLVPPSPTAST